MTTGMPSEPQPIMQLLTPCVVTICIQDHSIRFHQASNFLHMQSATEQADFSHLMLRCSSRLLWDTPLC